MWSPRQAVDARVGVQEHVHGRGVFDHRDCALAIDRRDVVVLDVDPGVYANGQGPRAVCAPKRTRKARGDAAPAVDAVRAGHAISAGDTAAVATQNRRTPPTGAECY